MNNYRSISKLKFLSVFLFFSIIGAIAFAEEPTAGQAVQSAEEPTSHRQSIEEWRTSRHERLSRANGWLTLVGLEWLKDGENRIGSADGNDIRLTKGPAYWGSVFLEGDKLSFVNPDNQHVTVDGEIVTQADLTYDTMGRPTIVASDTLSFLVIYRESYALRIKDSQAQALLNFKGVENYEIDESWRIDGRFIRAEEGASIEIVNVLGQVSQSPVYGTFEFDRDGKTHSLIGLGSLDSEELWFIFADRTSGRETYGAGRFLYSDGMPENGRLVVDFNKAYNPPCAFNPYSTCPLPPQRNRMDVAVTAGEKDFHPASG